MTEEHCAFQATQRRLALYTAHCQNFSLIWVQSRSQGARGMISPLLGPLGWLWIAFRVVAPERKTEMCKSVAGHIPLVDAPAGAGQAAGAGCNCTPPALLTSCASEQMTLHQLNQFIDWYPPLPVAAAQRDMLAAHCGACCLNSLCRERLVAAIWRLCKRSLALPEHQLLGVHGCSGCTRRSCCGSAWGARGCACRRAHAVDEDVNDRAAALGAAAAIAAAAAAVSAAAAAGWCVSCGDRLGKASGIKAGADKRYAPASERSAGSGRRGGSRLRPAKMLLLHHRRCAKSIPAVPRRWNARG